MSNRFKDISRQVSVTSWTSVKSGGSDQGGQIANFQRRDSQVSQRSRLDSQVSQRSRRDSYQSQRSRLDSYRSDDSEGYQPNIDPRYLPETHFRHDDEFLYEGSKEDINLTCCPIL